MASSRGDRIPGAFQRQHHEDARRFCLPAQANLKAGLQGGERDNAVCIKLAGIAPPDGRALPTARPPCGLQAFARIDGIRRLPLESQSFPVTERRDEPTTYPAGSRKLEDAWLA